MNRMNNFILLSTYKLLKFVLPPQKIQINCTCCITIKYNSSKVHTFNIIHIFVHKNRLHILTKATTFQRNK